LCPQTLDCGLFFEEPMSLPKPDIHVRLSTEAKAMLSLLAQVEQVPESVLAGRYLEETILGRSHALTVAARKLRRQGFSGNDGDE
jgi:hypothetical protein